MLIHDSKLRSEKPRCMILQWPIARRKLIPSDINNSIEIVNFNAFFFLTRQNTSSLKKIIIGVNAWFFFLSRNTKNVFVSIGKWKQDSNIKIIGDTDWCFFYKKKKKKKCIFYVRKHEKNSAEFSYVKKFTHLGKQNFQDSYTLKYTKNFLRLYFNRDKKFTTFGDLIISRPVVKFMTLFILIYNLELEDYYNFCVITHFSKWKKNRSKYCREHFVTV